MYPPSVDEKPKIVKTEARDGYELRVMCYSGGFEMVVAVTPEGHYIGSEKDAEILIKLFGIQPELASPSHNTCSIGFSEKSQKWYGWSHRAMYGFGIGHVVEEGDEGAQGTPEETCTCEHSRDEHSFNPELPACTAGRCSCCVFESDDRGVPVGFEVKTLEDAKRVAIAFAESVS